MNPLVLFVLFWCGSFVFFQEKHEHQEPGQEEQVHAESEILQLNPDTLRDLRLTTRKAERRPAADIVTAYGSLELNPNAVHLISTLFPARILSIHKTPGEKVEAGEVLVEMQSLDFARAQLLVEASQTRIEIAQTRMELARRQTHDLQNLAQQKMVKIQEVQAAEAELAVRTAKLAEAQLQLREAERALALFAVEPDTTLGTFKLRAPAFGTLMFRDGSIGESVEAGHVFFRIADISSLVAVAYPFERDGFRVDEKTKALVFPAAHPGRSMPAEFLWAGPEVDSVSRTLPVRFSVANPEALLLPGMSVTAEIRLSATSLLEVVTVPLAAVQRIEQNWCVFIPKGSGQFERRVIARGRDLGGEIEVLSGLKAGEEIVVEGAFVLRSESTRGEDAGEGHHHD